jgi:anti-sigma B factor antagonist
MAVETTQFKRCDVVKMAGRIDSATASDLKKAMDGILDAGRYKIVFDMSEVEFLSSSGVWVLLETQKKCKRWNRGDLVIASANDNIQRTLDLAGLKHFMRMYDDITSAVAGF